MRLTLLTWAALAVWLGWAHGIPAGAAAGFIGAAVGHVLGWGIGGLRPFSRVALGAAGAAVASLIIAFVGMAIPNRPHQSFCRQPGVYCEDFSGALLALAWPFLIGAVALLAVAVRAATLAAVGAYRASRASTESQRTG